ncbi:hypothetical protein ACNOYE_35055 [Nannocystaceae bacterium ST9]
MRRFACLVCLSVIACLSVTACMPSDDPPEQPDAASPAPSAAPIEAEPGEVEANADEWFLGFVSKTGVEHCPTESDEQWLAIQSTLGFIATSGASLEGWMGKPVLARGRASAGPKLELPTQPKPCPMMQMRSDWVNTPVGIRLDRGNHPAIEHFTVASVEPLAGLRVTREGEELIVEFENPLPFALAEFGMTLHYEGCYGKPGSTQQSREAKPLAVGERRVERFAIVDEKLPPPGERKGGRPARFHLARSLELAATPVEGSPPLYVDLDAPLASLGLALECPERAK